MTKMQETLQLFSCRRRKRICESEKKKGKLPFLPEKSHPTAPPSRHSWVGVNRLRARLEEQNAAGRIRVL